MLASAVVAIPGFSEPFSSLSHLIGAAVFLVLGVLLVRKGVEARRRSGAGVGGVLSLAVFSVSAVLLLCMSGVFHLATLHSGAREVLKRLDHAAIFVLIAGTFTPVHTILFRGPWRWGMLAFIWMVAALGVTLKSIYFANLPQTAGLVLYVAMGWVGLLSMIMFWLRHGPEKLWPLVAGGLVYTAGAVVEWAEPADLVPGVIRAHEVFHVAVLIGLGLHWRFMWSIADHRVV
jgi:channel protein (hemolysin III family)